MIRLVVKLYESMRKRWSYAAFRLNSRAGQVLIAGKLWINVPFRCDGYGQVQLGPRVSIGYPGAPILGDGMVRLQARAKHVVIEVGAGTYLSNNVQVISESRISIGSGCLIGDGVLIIDSDFHDLSAAARDASAPLTSSSITLTAPVIIEDNVFIGSRVIILKGVTIGKDSVIGAGSVVVRSIPPGVIAAGNPAKVIRPL
jgi:maltose O-acetyltransferase